MTASCPLCGAEQAEGLLCHEDTSRLERELGDVAAIVAELDISLSKQARIGTPGKSGLARERMPINVGAMQAADTLGNVLTTWARDVWGEPEVMSVSPNVSITSAWMLLSNIPLIRRHPAVTELVDEITDAVHQARRAVDRPADRKFFGTCYAETPDPEGRAVTCLEEIWASPAAQEVTCKVCGITHEIAERRAWLMRKAEDMIMTVPEASVYVGDVGHIKVTQASIRGYIHRKRLTYRAPVEAKRIRLGDLLAVVMDESERKGAA